MCLDKEIKINKQINKQTTITLNRIMLFKYFIKDKRNTSFMSKYNK